MSEIKKTVTGLTEKQRARMPAYVEKWIKIGCDTGRIDRAFARSHVQYLYTKILDKSEVPPIFFCRSPKEAWQTVCFLLEAALEGVSITEDMPIGRAEKLKLDFVYPYMDGSFFVGYFAFYDFLFSETSVTPLSGELLERYNWYRDTTQLSLIYPLKEFCVLSEKPIKVKMRNGVLHADGESALEYSDGFSLYMLNGVQVPKAVALTPWDKLDPHLILTEKNAEVRREIVRKIGIERICAKLNAKVLDREGEMYELLELSSGENRASYPFLKMLNPSIGCYHIEGVPVGTKTVKQALEVERKPDWMRKIPMSEDGLDWYQQGDVLIVPNGAKSLKPRPSILT